MRALPPFTRPYLANSWFRYVGDPDDPVAAADMTSRSPVAMIDRINTPLLIAQGANDARVAQAESDDVVTPLRERGVPVEYLLAADEGHGFDNPRTRSCSTERSSVTSKHTWVVGGILPHLRGNRRGSCLAAAPVSR